MTHIEQRLLERDIHISKAVLTDLCYEYECVAVILAKQSHYGQSDGDYMSRSESNGDLVVLIIRDHKAITIMYRRSSQTNTAQQLRVNQVIDLTQ